MNHLDLFSGIGGFALAARWVWGTFHQVLSFVETDPFCQRVLRKHWPEVPIHDDIKTFSATKLVGKVDLLTGGFPCQPFSLAGKQRGKEDDRYLWPEMLRIIEECRPRWVVAENVTGIINLALDDVLSDLEGLGYEAWSVVIPACAVNAPHRRDRVWIVAYNVADTDGSRFYGKGLSILERTAGQEGIDIGREGSPLADSERWRDGERTELCGSGEGRVKGTSGDGSFTENRDVAYTDSSRLERLSRFQDPSELPSWAGGRLPMPWPVTEQVEEGREVERVFCGVADGIPDRVDECELRPVRDRRQRLQKLGNAIVPQVAMVLFAALKNIEEALKC